MLVVALFTLQVFAPISIEDFESYASTLDAAGVWYQAPHGNKIIQTLESKTVGGGKQALKIAYQIEEKPTLNYIGICALRKWNLSGANAFRVWLKPDGSGRHLGIQFNIADVRGVNIHDLWDATYVPEKGDKSARWVTIPFKDLRQDSRFSSGVVAKEFKPDAVIEIAFYISTKKGYFGKGNYILDELQAVRVDN